LSPSTPFRTSSWSSPASPTKVSPTASPCHRHRNRASCPFRPASPELHGKQSSATSWRSPQTGPTLPRKSRSLKSSFILAWMPNNKDSFFCLRHRKDLILSNKIEISLRQHVDRLSKNVGAGYGEIRWISKEQQQLENLIIDGLITNGGHHKQCYLEALGLLVRVSLRAYPKGSLPIASKTDWPMTLFRLLPRRFL
jgi:hypothetical protein